MIQTIQLTPGVVLRHYPDKRFKTAVLSVQFQRPLCREEAALNALLTILSTPMIASGYWALSLFLWAFLFIASCKKQ